MNVQKLAGRRTIYAKGASERSPARYTQPPYNVQRNAGADAWQRRKT
nr:MAG TPA: hypothetical protein [Caudoviricetes sp.]